MPGPIVRTDIVEVFVFRLPDPAGPGLTAIEFLQLHRTSGELPGTWQPVMGHVETGETATQAALRELAEETGCKPSHGLTTLWQLESLNTYFLSKLDCIVMSPGFAVQVQPTFKPTLDHAHDDFRWVPRDHADRLFLWPGQKAAVDQIVRDILSPGSPATPHLKIHPPM